MMAIELIEDTLIYPRLVELAACLCEEITRSGLFAGQELCFCGLQFGDQVPIDLLESKGVGSGVAWVRMDNVFPSTSFPNPDSGDGSCSTLLAYEIEVAIARCVPVLDRNGKPPGVDATLQAARMQLADMAAMRRAISCCFTNSDIDYTLVQYNPIPVSGGVGGGFWQVISRQEF
jgi:hypothetical protein